LSAVAGDRRNRDIRCIAHRRVTTRARARAPSPAATTYSIGFVAAWTGSRVDLTIREFSTSQSRCQWRARRQRKPRPRSTNPPAHSPPLRHDVSSRGSESPRVAATTSDSTIIGARGLMTCGLMTYPLPCDRPYLHVEAAIRSRARSGRP